MSGDLYEHDLVTRAERRLPVHAFQRGYAPGDFTILPVWAPPYCHYSIDRRRQAWDEICVNIDIGWDQAAPHCKDPTRLPDAGTLRQWACARRMGGYYVLKACASLDDTAGFDANLCDPHRGS